LDFGVAVGVGDFVNASACCGAAKAAAVTQFAPFSSQYSVAPICPSTSSSKVPFGIVSPMPTLPEK